MAEGEDLTVARAIQALEKAGGAARDELYVALRDCAEAFRVGKDRQTLKTVATRDMALAALAGLLPRPLGTLVRRQLGDCMCELLKSEGRALVPLLDALVGSLAKACKDPKASGADSAKVNTLGCTEALLERFGVLCASRVDEIFALAKSCLKEGEDPAVRLAAIRVLVLVVRHGGPSAHAHHAEALKVCKGTLQDKQSPLLRMGAGDLLVALARHAEKVHTLGLEGMLQMMIKSLGEGGRAHEVDGRHASEVIGHVLACLASRSGGGATAPGFRQRAGQGVGLLAKRRDVGSVRAAHELLASIFCNPKCPPPLRAGIARAYRALLCEMALVVPEAELVTYATLVLMLAVAAPEGASLPVGGGGRWLGSVMEDGRHVCACIMTVMSGLTERLSEDGKLLLVQVLIADLAKRKALLLPHMSPSSSDAAAAGTQASGSSSASMMDLRQALPVTCALQALTSLYCEIGGCQPTRETWDQISALLLAPWTAARVAAAQCLRAIGSKAPHLLLPALRRVVEQIASEAVVADCLHGAAALQGRCMGLSATAMAARIHSHGVSCELLDSIMSVANMLFKESSRSGAAAKWTRSPADAEMQCSRVEGGWLLVCVCLRADVEWVACYVPVVLKLCSDFLPAAIAAESSEVEWQQAMLGAASALSALRVLVQDHAQQLLKAPEHVSHVKQLLQRVLHSDLVVKSAKVAAGYSSKANPAGALLWAALVDVVKQRLLEVVAVMPQALLLPTLYAAILKRALQVVARAPAKRGATSSIGSDLVNPDDDVLLPEYLRRSPLSLPLDDVGAETLCSWLEFDIAGGGSDARFTTMDDAVLRPERGVSRPLAQDLSDAGVAAMMKVFPLAKVDEQSAVLGAVVNNILTINDAAQRELALENVCTCLLASLKTCAERGWALPSSTDWRTRTTDILMSALSARHPPLQRLAAEALSVLLRLTSEKHLQHVLAILNAPPPPTMAPTRKGSSLSLSAMSVAASSAGVRDTAAGVDARGSYALAMGCAYRYVGGMRMNQFVSAEDTLQRLLDWANGVPDPAVAAAAAAAAARVATAEAAAVAAASIAMPSALTRAWILHGAALVVEYSSVASDSLSVCAFREVRKGFSSQVSEDEAPWSFAQTAPTLSISLADLAGAAVVSLGPELTIKSTELRVLMALSDELLVRGLSDSLSACESAMQALALVQRLVVYTCKLVPPQQLIMRVAALLEHPSPFVRRRAVATLRQITATSAPYYSASSAAGPAGVKGGIASLLFGLEKRLLRLLDKELDAVVQEDARALASWMLLPPTSTLPPMQVLDLLHQIVAGKHSGGSLFPDAAPPADVSLIWAADGCRADGRQAGCDEETGGVGVGLGGKTRRASNESDDEDAKDGDWGDDGGAASFSEGGDGAAGKAGEEVQIAYQPRWQTRHFALLCLQGLISAVGAGANSKQGAAASTAVGAEEDVNADFSRAHLDLALARKSEGGASAYLVGKMNALVSICYLAVSSTNLMLRVEGVALLEAVVRTLAQCRDPDMVDDDDEDEADAVGEGPSLLDQCQAQISSILRLALGGSNSAPSLKICACNVCYELLARRVHGDEDVVRRTLLLLLQLVVSRANERDATYSDVAASTVQVSVLSTLARIYVTPGPHQGTLRRTLETSQGVAEAGQGHRRGVAWLISLWSGCVKYAVKIDSGLIQPAPLSDVEETVSGGVFSQDMEVLLKSSAPLLLRAAAALVHDAGPEIISDSEVVEATLQLSPLALLLLQRECDSSSNGLKDGGGTAAVAGRAASSCALASSLCSLLCARAVSLVMASVSSTSKQQMHNILQVALDTSLALICTPAHLSVADAGVELMVQLHTLHHLTPATQPSARTLSSSTGNACAHASDAPKQASDTQSRQGVLSELPLAPQHLLEMLLTPLAAVLHPAPYGLDSRRMRLNSAAMSDTFAVARAGRSLAGAARFLNELGPSQDVAVSVAQALPRLCVAAVSLLQGGVRGSTRLHAAALALLEAVLAWTDRTHALLGAACREEGGGSLGVGGEPEVCVWKWRKALGECGVAAVLGLLRESSAAGQSWRKEQVQALLLMIYLSASPHVGDAAEEASAAAASARYSKHEQAEIVHGKHLPESAAHGEHGTSAQQPIESACEACVCLVQARLGDWWWTKVGGHVPSSPFSPQVSESSSWSKGFAGNGDLFGAASERKGMERDRAGADGEDDTEADGWFSGLVAGLEFGLTKTQAASSRRRLAQTLMAALLPSIQEVLLAGPPPHVASATAMSASRKESLAAMHERLCTHLVRVLVLCHRAVREAAGAAGTGGLPSKADAVEQLASRQAEVLRALLVTLVRLAPRSLDANAALSWPPPAIGLLAAKTITALATVDTAAFRAQVATMSPEMQQQLRSALAAVR